MGLIGCWLCTCVQSEYLRATDVADSDCGGHGRRCCAQPRTCMAAGGSFSQSRHPWPWGRSTIAKMGGVDCGQGKMRGSLGGGSRGSECQSDRQTRIRLVGAAWQPAHRKWAQATALQSWRSTSPTRAEGEVCGSVGGVTRIPGASDSGRAVAMELGLGTGLIQ